MSRTFVHVVRNVVAGRGRLGHGRRRRIAAARRNNAGAGRGRQHFHLTGLLKRRHEAQDRILVRRLGDHADFVVFGVVTEYCVSFAAKGLLERGWRVAIVQDAIETLKSEDGQKTIAELGSLGARLTTTDQALSALRH